MCQNQRFCLFCNSLIYNPKFNNQNQILNRGQAESGVELARTWLRREGEKAADGRLILNFES